MAARVRVRRSPRRRCRAAAPSMRTSSAAKRLAGGGREDRLDRPVLAGGERRDLALALDDEADRDRLDAAGRQAARTLRDEERAQRVADEAVDDPARLLRVDEVHVDLARVGEGLADRRLGDLVEGDPARLVAAGRGRPRRRARRSPRPRGRGRWRGRPGRRLGGLLDVGDLLAAVVRDHVLGFEVVVDVDAELALARVLGQVADMAVGREDAVIGAEIALDGARLGRRFDDDEVLGHGRECSTGSLPRPFSDLADPAQEVLVDLEVGLGLGRPGWRRGARRRLGLVGRDAPSTGRRPRSRPAGSRRTGCGGTGRRRSTLMSSTKTGRLPFIIAQVRAAQPDVARRGRLEQVGQQRLLVVEVQDDVADHAPIVARRRAASSARRWSGQGW